MPIAEDMFPFGLNNHNASTGPRSQQQHSYDDIRRRVAMHQLLLLQQESLRQQEQQQNNNNNRVVLELQASHQIDLFNDPPPFQHANRTGPRLQDRFPLRVGAAQNISTTRRRLSITGTADYQQSSSRRKSPSPQQKTDVEESTTNTQQPSSNSRQVALENLWEDMYRRLVEYKRKHNHCLVPNRYKEDKQLGSWVSTQRRNYGRGKGMSQDRIDRLEALGFVWKTSDPRSTPWMERYKQLSEFYDTYGHSVIPVMYEPNKPLANWVSAQRQEYRYLVENKPSRITAERIVLLNKLDFMWDALRHRAPTSMEDDCKHEDDSSTDNNVTYDSAVLTTTVVQSASSAHESAPCRSEHGIQDVRSVGGDDEKTGSEDGGVVDEVTERRLRKRVMEAARKETDPQILAEVKQLGIEMLRSSISSRSNKRARTEPVSDENPSSSLDEDTATASYGKSSLPVKASLSSTPYVEATLGEQNLTSTLWTPALGIGHVSGMQSSMYPEYVSGHQVRLLHLTSATSASLGLSSVQQLRERPFGLLQGNRVAQQGLAHEHLAALMLNRTKRQFGKRTSTNATLIPRPADDRLAVTAAALGFRSSSDEDQSLSSKSSQQASRGNSNVGGQRTQSPSSSSDIV